MPASDSGVVALKGGLRRQKSSMTMTYLLVMAGRRKAVSFDRRQ